jgi:hypothetical protein
MLLLRRAVTGPKSPINPEMRISAQKHSMSDASVANGYGHLDLLPGGARFEIEMQWGPIGWAVPATFGYAVGARQRRVIDVGPDIRNPYGVTIDPIIPTIRREAFDNPE